MKDDALFATNTSSLAVADQAAATSRPEQFLGLHFFNPVQVMPLLEVVRGEGTAEETADAGFAFGDALGKTTVAAGDNRGFIVNRLLVPFMLDGDQRVRGGRRLRRGHRRRDDGRREPPDGPDHARRLRRSRHACASIASVMHDYYGEERFAAPPTLRTLVDAGHYGRKSGRGLLRLLGREARRSRPRKLTIVEAADTPTPTPPPRSGGDPLERRGGSPRDLPAGASRLRPPGRPRHARPGGRLDGGRGGRRLERRARRSRGDRQGRRADRRHSERGRGRRAQASRRGESSTRSAFEPTPRTSRARRASTPARGWTR